jgi:hypothetical protein
VFFLEEKKTTTRNSQTARPLLEVRASGQAFSPSSSLKFFTSKTLATYVHIISSYTCHPSI